MEMSKLKTELIAKKKQNLKEQKLLQSPSRGKKGALINQKNKKGTKIFIIDDSNKY